MFASLNRKVPIRLIVTFCFAFTVFFAIGSTNCRSAQDISSGDILFIFDASGSMWGQVKGKNKISIAKEVLSDLVQGLKANPNVGLVAYGHRKKGDCKDVEELAPLAPLNKEKIISLIKDINPKGKTPITLSVKMSADLVKDRKKETTIILISDGIETCGGDPCELVKELKKAGIKFVMHVIGFDVQKEAADQLACMAKAGGGEYFSADNAAQFKKAAVKAVEKSAGHNLEISAYKNGKLIAADVFVYKKGNEKKAVNKQSSEHDPARFKLPAGEYEAKIVDEWSDQKSRKYLKNIIIKDGETTVGKVEFGGGVLNVKVLKNGKPFHADVFVYKNGSQKHMANKQGGKQGPVSFKLGTGAYNVVVKDEWGAGDVIRFDNIDLNSGDNKDLTANFANGSILVTVLKGGKMYVADVFVYKKGMAKAVENKQSREDIPVVFEVLAGTYKVRIKDEWGDGSVKEINDVVVEGGKKQKIEVVF